MFKSTEVALLTRTPTYPAGKTGAANAANPWPPEIFPKVVDGGGSRKGILRM
jgi:hypothetical protein